MISRIAAVGAATALLASSSVASAERSRGAFLDAEPSARLAALQGTAAAADPDALALFHLPLPLVDAEGWKVGAAYQGGVLHTSTQAVAITMPAHPLGLGGGILLNKIDGVVVTDDQGQPVENWAAYDSVGVISAAAKWREGSALGVSVKGFTSRLGDKSVSGVAIDAAVRLAMRVSLLGGRWTDDAAGSSVATVALALRNAGTEGAFLYARDPLPIAFSLAVAYSFPIAEAHRFLLAGLVERPLDRIEPTHVGVGLEYRFAGWLLGRAGYALNETLNRVGVGLGVQYADFSLDWAYHPYAELGATQRLSLAYEIPHPPAR